MPPARQTAPRRREPYLYLFILYSHKKLAYLTNNQYIYINLKAYKNMKEEMEKDERFIIRTYEKAELAHLYNPNMPLVSAMRKLRAWIRRNRQLTDALTATGENKRDHSYTPRQVSLIVAVLGEP